MGSTFDIFPNIHLFLNLKGVTYQNFHTQNGRRPKPHFDKIFIKISQKARHLYYIPTASKQQTKCAATDTCKFIKPHQILPNLN